jgi:hypothetical protein
MAPHITNPLSASGTGYLTVVTATQQDGALYCNNNHAHAALHRVLVRFTGYYGVKFTTFVSADACVQHKNKGNEQILQCQRTAKTSSTLAVSMLQQLCLLVV